MSEWLDSSLSLVCPAFDGDWDPFKEYTEDHFYKPKRSPSFSLTFNLKISLTPLWRVVMAHLCSVATTFESAIPNIRKNPTRFGISICEIEVLAD